MRRGIPFAVATLVAAVLAASLALPADELKLKDGTRITGTIVGFEENSFKVQTSYGFAIVQKDQVASISMSDATKAAGKSPAAAKPAKSDNAKAPAAASTPQPQTASAAAPPAVAPATPTTPAKPTVAKTAAPPAAAPAPPAAPEPIREEVSGNLYTNETYGFRMFKPPDWQVIPGARAMLPGAIAAMGTDDQTTYLLIGQQPAGKSLASDISATEKRLTDVMDNFRPLGETHIKISDLDAIERRFRGSVDDRDWSGTVVFVPRGSHLFTIFGMTLADSDLVQIQENVIARTIASLEFTSP